MNPSEWPPLQITINSPTVTWQWIKRYGTWYKKKEPGIYVKTERFVNQNMG